MTTSIATRVASWARHPRQRLPEEPGNRCYTDAPELSEFGDGYWSLQAEQPAALYDPVELP
ncbi:hypothetical protein ACFYRN_44865 [Streptomyces sp. NPDC005227]|uniref:hypothetical protein n=1 Tax=Streptomyces sp. NPDC005227 TaxID=3364707 RepID=UPI0036CA5166